MHQSYLLKKHPIAIANSVFPALEIRCQTQNPLNSKSRFTTRNVKLKMFDLNQIAAEDAMNTKASNYHPKVC